MVHGKLRYRFEPFEWVYDGLKPLLLPDVLQTQKGMSLSLAALYCCVARRIGLQLVPVPIYTTGGKLPELECHPAGLGRRCDLLGSLMIMLKAFLPIYLSLSGSSIIPAPDQHVPLE